MHFMHTRIDAMGSGNRRRVRLLVESTQSQRTGKRRSVVGLLEAFPYARTSNPARSRTGARAAPAILTSNCSVPAARSRPLCGVSSQGRPYRILYAFDPRRTAILLIGGDKTGADRWYEVHIPLADSIYDTYCEQLKKEGLL